jgi:nucleoside-diphosphate kinase
MMQHERTLVLIKPDGIQRRLVGEIISRLERKGLQLLGIKLLTLNNATLAQHYRHLADQPFYKEIEEFMKSSPVVATCWGGLEAVATVRALCGITKSREAAPGTIRGDLAMSVQANVVHASDSSVAAKEEIDRFFAAGEIFEYDDRSLPFLYSRGEQPVA